MKIKIETGYFTTHAKLQQFLSDLSQALEILDYQPMDFELVTSWKQETKKK
jgi:hypothetical protein